MWGMLIWVRMVVGDEVEEGRRMNAHVSWGGEGS